MGFSFLVTLREGVEMALILSILLGYLRSIGQRQHFLPIWAGVGIAAAACLALGAGLELASAEMDKRVVEAFEGFAMIFAVVVLTGMAVWMRRQAAGISRELREQVNAALGRGSMAALVLLGATSIGREGLETVLFLFAGSTNGASGAAYWAGGVLGFAVAALIGVGIYKGSSRLPLRQFFTISGVAVLMLAAGLLANSVVKLYEAGLLSSLGARPWDTDGVVTMTSTLGKFLNTLAGYDSAPSVTQIALYWGYLVVAVAVFLWTPVAKPSPRGSRAGDERAAQEAAG